MTIPGYDYDRERIPGIGRTIGAGGDSPHQSIRGFTVTHDKRFYFSRREIALLLEKTFKAGYGVLPIGTVMAEDFNDHNMLVPYTPDTIDYKDVSRVFLLQDLTAGTSMLVDIMESYKLRVLDYIVLSDTDGTYETERISAIDRTTYASIGQAVVTISQCAGTFTVAKKACCWVKARTEADTNKCSLAKYILEMNVDTGAGDRAVDGLGSVLISNAVVYIASCVGMDATAISALGVLTDGVYYILK